MKNDTLTVRVSRVPFPSHSNRGLREDKQKQDQETVDRIYRKAKDSLQKQRDS